VRVLRILDGINAKCRVVFCMIWRRAKPYVCQQMIELNAQPTYCQKFIINCRKKSRYNFFS